MEARLQKEAENRARRQKEAENTARRQKEAENKEKKEAENTARRQKEAENKEKKEAENTARRQKEAENKARRQKEAEKRRMTATTSVPKSKKMKQQTPKIKVIVSPRRPKSVGDQRRKNVKLQIERMKRIRTRGQERKKFLNRLERGEDPYKVLMDAKKLNFNRAGGTM
jgi:colicin import membrane protein